jgi:hypothetical protein
MLGSGVEFLRAALRTDALPADLADSGQAIVDALDALGARVDDAMPVYTRELAQADGDEVLLAQPFGERSDAAAGAPYDRFRAYRSALESSLHSIDDVASLGGFRVRTGSSAAPSEPIELGTGDEGALLAADRARIEEALAGVSDVPEEQSALRDLQAWLTRFWTDPKAK